MNKKLIAVAVAGVLAAPLAAQADVTIYGKVHMSVDWYDNAVSGERATDDDDDDDELLEDRADNGLGVSSNSSRVGFRGSEDLGGGLKGVWQVESEVRLDEAGDTFATRNSFLGLASGFGTVIFGRHDSPFKDVGRKLDIFGDTIGDTRALTRLQPVSLNVLGVSVADIPVSGGAGLVGWDERLDNLIAYISPDFAGFKLFAAYSTDIQRETQTAVVIPGVLELSPYRSFLPAPDNNDADAWSASLTYETGPFFAAVAYEGHSFIVDQIDPVTGAIISSDEEDEDGWRVGGGVTFGPAKVGAMWQHTSTDFNPFEEDVDNDRDVWNVFGQFAFGATNIGLQWTRADESDLEDDGANLYSLGLFHNLSKRTQVYAMYSYLDNDEDAFFALAGGGGHGDTYFPSFDNDDMEFEDVQAASVGVIHSF